MKTFVIAFLLTSAAIVTGGAATFPSASTTPLSTVLKALEAGGLQDFTGVDFDDGRWEIKAVRNGVCIEAWADPTSAKVIGERPDDHHAPMPAGSQKLSTVVKRLEEAGYRSIDDIELEGTSWELKAWREGKLEHLRVDALTGALLSERNRAR